MDKPRLTSLAEADMDEAQRRVANAIESGPRGGLRGPFGALLRSPELADRLQKLGAYVRFESSLPPRLSELAILVTARYWGAQYEWWAHRRLAEQAGLAPRIAEAIAAGRRPRGMGANEAAVYDFCKALHEKKRVGDAAWRAALEHFGERGVIDLIGTCGYYTVVSMVLNATRHPLPEGVAPPLRALSPRRRSPRAAAGARRRKPAGSRSSGSGRASS
ncbi:MAG TPA: carboxymuconolactone decarboxylase family protein [Burkholderiales bacterium]|nr:carboxymuconolactone decarboxylase family protein [Burkholderiales bacterium]